MATEFSSLNFDNYLAAYEIQHRCHFNPWSESVFKDCLSPPYFAEQLTFEGDVVGYYVGMDVAGEATLMDIGVTDNCRGKGYGRLLLEHFINQCQQRNCEAIWLEVRHSNAPAIHLYQQFDFILIETRKDYYPSESGKEDALIMKRDARTA